MDIHQATSAYTNRYRYALVQFGGSSQQVVSGCHIPNKNPLLHGVGYRNEMLRYGPEGIRTPDLYSAIVARSQLRYGPILLPRKCIGQVIRCQGLKIIVQLVYNQSTSIAALCEGAIIRVYSILSMINLPHL